MGEGHKIAEDSRFIKANQGTIDQATEGGR